MLDHIAIGSGGLAARFGGEEFVIRLKGVDPAAASAAAEKITRRFEELALAHAACPRKRRQRRCGERQARASSDAACLVTEVDRALYRAKVAGRGCYRLATAEDSVRPFDVVPKRPAITRPADRAAAPRKARRAAKRA